MIVVAMKKKYQIHIEKDENNIYVWEVVWLPACYTQAKTLSVLFDRLAEVTEWSVDLMKDMEWKNISKMFNLSMEIEYA